MCACFAGAVGSFFNKPLSPNFSQTALHLDFSSNFRKSWDRATLRSATVPSPHLAIISRSLDFLNAFASPMQVAKRSNCAFSTVRGQRLSPAVDNGSLEVTTSTRSRTRRARKGTAGEHAVRARRLGAMAGPRAPEAGAAQQEQPPWLHDVHVYHLKQPATGGYRPDKVLYKLWMGTFTSPTDLYRGGKTW